jgi:shikimate 5-dehydrogenase
MTGRVLFVGVSTGGSRIHGLFPTWMDVLGLDVELEGVDLPLGSPAASYRELVAAFPADDALRGAVITSHKLGFYAATRGLMRAADETADALEEFNSIARHADGSLTGHARDPVAVEAVLPSVLGEHFTRRDVILLGAGGAGSAIALSLLAAHPPRRLVAVDTLPERLEALRALLGSPPATELTFIVSDDAARNDALLTEAAPGSLVVNATGMGKDTPGAPLTAGAVFPRGGIAWDLNYRGELEFLAIARAGQDERDLTVHDGFEYFLHGWAAALAPVLDIDMTPALFARLRDAAVAA